MSIKIDKEKFTVEQRLKLLEQQVDSLKDNFIQFSKMTTELTEIVKELAIASRR